MRMIYFLVLLIFSGIVEATSYSPRDLRLAIYRSNYDEVKKILEFGVNPNVDLGGNDLERSRALIYAGYNCEAKISKLLIEYGADVNIEVQNPRRKHEIYSPLLAVVGRFGEYLGYERCAKTAKILIDNGAKVNPDNPNDYHRNILSRGRLFRINWEFFDYLLTETDYNINSPLNYLGHTIIDQVLYRGYKATGTRMVETLEYLSSKGADFFQAKCSISYAFKYVFKSEKLELLDYLLAKGIVPNEDDECDMYTNLFYEIDQETLLVTERLLKSGAVLPKIVGQCKDSPIMAILREIENPTEKLSIIKLLNENGANMNQLGDIRYKSCDSDRKGALTYQMRILLKEYIRKNKMIPEVEFEILDYIVTNSSFDTSFYLEKTLNMPEEYWQKTFDILMKSNGFNPKSCEAVYGLEVAEFKMETRQHAVDTLNSRGVGYFCL